MPRLHQVYQKARGTPRSAAMLSRPYEYKAAWLRINPFCDPLRDHPRFQALLEKYE